MPGRSRDRRTTPTRPDLPAQLDPAPDDWDPDTAWNGLVAGATLSLPDVVHDLALDECVWREVDATARTFTGFAARDVRFVGCDFSGAVLDGAVLDRVEFAGCRLTGTVFSGAELTDVIVDGGVADLAGFRLSRSSFLWARDVSLREVDFYSAQVRRGALLGCDLTGADFDRATIDGLALHGSTLESIKGAAALADAGVTVAAEQVVPLGVAMLAAMGVGIADAPAMP